MPHLKKLKIPALIAGGFLAICTISYAFVPTPYKFLNPLSPNYLFNISSANKTNYQPALKKNIWLDAPIKDLEVNLGEEVKIVGHKIRDNNISHVEVKINSELADTVSTFLRNGVLDYFEYTWLATQPGEHLIQFVLIHQDETPGNFDSITITVLGELDSDTALTQDFLTPSPVRPTSAPVVAPTTAQLKPTGPSLPTATPEVKPTDPPASPQAPTPTPEPDTTPPSAPRLFFPINNHSFNCVGQVLLNWKAVYDPSGIEGYEVSVEHHWGDGNWDHIDETTFITQQTDQQVNTECGWYYRWKVRAKDKAGNIGDFSDWGYFLVTLM